MSESMAKGLYEASQRALVNRINNRLGRSLSDIMYIVAAEFPNFGALVIRPGLRVSSGPLDARMVAAEYAQFALSRPDGELMTMWRDHGKRKFWQINYLRYDDGVALLAFERSRRCVLSGNERIDEHLGYLARASR